MAGANLHTPSSIFQHMMGQHNVSQLSAPWMQIPQVPPISIPWSVPSIQQPELMRFTGGSSLEPIHHQKRKLEASDVVDTRQTKQFITEEKMAAHFKDLHISPNYQSLSPLPSTSTADTQSVLSKELNMDLDMGTTNTVDSDQTKSRHSKLILSDELKKLQPEPILPSSLLSKLERPSMALVLWEPPSKHLHILPSRDTPTPIPGVSDNNNNNNNNNNNEAIPDLNQTLQSSNTHVFEPMEL
ncbi:PREDICTED: ras guanine nucleotide exchange factor Y-like isoform X2 [Dufourea novaeangliae]|uniref:Uncharacterized protein n=2 Tax=Dufourea novaeangliae TaxID=178035 RepID=A0A154PLA5_DUFNO|nr:PREDICTED: ras guanine nucleotide exchange factor Y-like isoform X2 [Dufourea novaeangliae]XP_015435141.1 PREDICTED: ras guanine nucleotide exchange factor Y-like isoform X2 [Dufourea novaeangliae]KZC12655.1 hypothetical protein WN55_04121 [Dufourea novaeangliae]